MLGNEAHNAKKDGLHRGDVVWALEHLDCVL